MPRKFIKANFLKISLVVIAVLSFIYFLYFSTANIFVTTYSIFDNASSTGAMSGKLESPKDSVTHLKTPLQVKGIYMTSCVVGTPSLRDALSKLIDETELNAVVIDIKDFSGTVSFIPDNPSLKEFVSTRCFASDLKEFISALHEKGIYVIGRITVFQDPFFTKKRPDLAVKKLSDRSTWHDNKGLSFLDPGAKEVWDHIVLLSEESYKIGFDELNYDYIRYPSDGPMNDIYFSWSDSRKKADVLEDFFSYLNEKLKPLGVVTSADIFGMTTTNSDDLNIGQVLEKTLPYFDFISPMVYPSHYPPRFNGWLNPNALPYEVVKFSMDKAIARAAATSSMINTIGSLPIASTTPQLYTKEPYSPLKLRPWLQDFSLGSPPYGAKEVRAQIQAVYDAGLDSWALWNAANNYTKEALNTQ